MSQTIGSIATSVASFSTTGYEGIGLYLNSGALAFAAVTDQNATNLLPPYGILTGGGAAGQPLGIETQAGNMVQVRVGSTGITAGSTIIPEYAASLAAGGARFVNYDNSAAATGDWTWGQAMETSATPGAFVWVRFSPQQQTKLP